MKIFKTIRSRIIVYFGITFFSIIILLKVVEIYGLPFTNINGSYQNLRKEIIDNLNLVADLKKEKLQQQKEENYQQKCFQLQKSIRRKQVKKLKRL